MALFTLGTPVSPQGGTLRYEQLSSEETVGSSGALPASSLTAVSQLDDNKGLQGSGTATAITPMIQPTGNQGNSPVAAGGDSSLAALAGNGTTLGLHGLNGGAAMASIASSAASGGVFAPDNSQSAFDSRSSGGDTSANNTAQQVSNVQNMTNGTQVTNVTNNHTDTNTTNNYYDVLPGHGEPIAAVTLGGDGVQGTLLDTNQPVAPAPELAGTVTGTVSDVLSNAPMVNSIAEPVLSPVTDKLGSILSSPLSDLTIGHAAASDTPGGLLDINALSDGLLNPERSATGLELTLGGASTDGTDGGTLDIGLLDATKDILPQPLLELSAMGEAHDSTTGTLLDVGLLNDPQQGLNGLDLTLGGSPDEGASNGMLDIGVLASGNDILPEPLLDTLGGTTSGGEGALAPVTDVLPDPVADAASTANILDTADSLGTTVQDVLSQPLVDLSAGENTTSNSPVGALLDVGVADDSSQGLSGIGVDMGDTSIGGSGTLDIGLLDNTDSVTEPVTGLLDVGLLDSSVAPDSGLIELAPSSNDLGGTVTDLPTFDLGDVVGDTLSSATGLVSDITSGTSGSDLTPVTEMTDSSISNVLDTVSSSTGTTDTSLGTNIIPTTSTSVVDTTSAATTTVATTTTTITAPVAAVLPPPPPVVHGLFSH